MADDQRDTRERLLDNAEDLFAAEGFDAVSVRDIATAAGVNVAAVNYHFHGKEKLYHEVLERVVAGKRDRYLEAIRTAHEESPGDLEAAVRGFFRAHFEDTLKTERGGNFIKLFVREMHHGRPENAEIIAERLIPLWFDVGRAMLKNVPGINPAMGPWIVGSLHGQMVHFTMRWYKTRCRCQHHDSFHDTMSTLFPPLADDVDAYIDRAVDHITRFSVAGIQAVVDDHRTSTDEGVPS